MILKYENWYVPWEGTFAAWRAAAFRPARGQPNVIAFRSLRPSGGGAAGAICCACGAATVWVAATARHTTSAIAPVIIMLFMAFPRPEAGPKGPALRVRARTARPCC